MGADLYIKNLPREDQYTGFRSDVNVGYLRCAYNNSDVLWQFGLSWWTDVAEELTDGEGTMSVENAKKFLKLLKSKEKTFKHNLNLMLIKHNPVWDFTFADGTDKKIYKEAEITPADRIEWVKRYKADYKEMKAFLNRAIKLNSPIECSL